MEIVPRLDFRGAQTGAGGEVLIQRKQRIGLQFPVDASQFFFNPVDPVIEVALVDVQTAQHIRQSAPSR